LDLICVSTTPKIEIGTGASENFGLRDGVGEGVGGGFKLCALVAVGSATARRMRRNPGGPSGLSGGK